jgi:hypothetical protein
MLVKLIPLIIITIELILIALMIRFDAVGNKRLLASQNWKMQPKCWVTGLADKLQHTYITTGLASERERERVRMPMPSCSPGIKWLLARTFGAMVAVDG